VSEARPRSASTQPVAGRTEMHKIETKPFFVTRIAKIGLGSHAVDPRELLLHRAADGSTQQPRQPTTQR
jgi:hypothetical protein